MYSNSAFTFKAETFVFDTSTIFERMNVFIKKWHQQNMLLAERPIALIEIVFEKSKKNKISKI